MRAASIEGTGVVQELALAHYDSDARRLGKPRWFRTPLELLSLKGTLSELGGKPELRLTAMASRLTDNGIEVIGGVVVSATVLNCELVIEAMDDVLFRRGADRHSGLLVWQQMLGALPSAPPAPGDEPPRAADSETGNGARSWAAAAEASAAAEAAAAEAAAAREEEEEPYRPIRIGDFLEHRKFGRCVVERVDANEEFATVRLRNNRLVRLNIDVLNLRYQGDEDGKQVFASQAR